MSSGFISEAEIAEHRRARQQEWERVRTADQPLEAPEGSYDPRSLYEQLQEQKSKRDAEYEEAHKLKNMIKGLDDDEVEFLDLVDRTKLEEERKKNLEEEKEMRDFKAAVASLQERSLNEKLKQELKNPQATSKNISSGSGRTSQLKLLAGVVVKRSEKQKQGTVLRGVKRKLSDDENDSETKEDVTKEDVTNEQIIARDAECRSSMFTDNYIEMKTVTSEMSQTSASMKCIGILPGLGYYEDSSCSDCSSDTDPESELSHTKYDLLGREIKLSKDEGKSCAYVLTSSTESHFTNG